MKRNLFVLSCFLVFLVCATSLYAQYTVSTTSEPVDWGVLTVDSLIQRWPNPQDIAPTVDWEYSVGIVLVGVERIWNKTGNSAYLNYIQNYVDQHVDANGNIAELDPSGYNIDKIQPGRQVQRVYEETDLDKYRKGLFLLRNQFYTWPRTSEGGLWHKFIRTNQMWADSINMGQPYVVKYGHMFGDEDYCVKEAINQITLLGTHAKDPATNLLFHGWDESKAASWADPTTGCAPEIWDRAMGWVIMGVADVIEHIPEEYPERTQIIAQFEEMVAALAGMQDDKTGLWYQVVDKGHLGDNWVETTGCGMIVYGIAKAVRQGYLNPVYLDVAKKGFSGMMAQNYLDGSDLTVITNATIAMGIMDNYANYVNMSRLENSPHGMCAMLAACAGMEDYPLDYGYIGDARGGVQDLDTALLKSDEYFYVIPLLPNETRKTLKDFFSIIYMEAQAHADNAAKAQTEYQKLIDYVFDGGVLVLFEPSATAWNTSYLPYTINMSATAQTTQNISISTHTIFNTPNVISNLSGMVEDDSISSVSGDWTVLATNNAGNPSIVEAGYGAGWIIVCEPSVGRYYANDTNDGDYDLLFENIVAYAKSKSTTTLDMELPTKVVNTVVQFQKDHSFHIKWQPSMDNKGVTGYRIHRSTKQGFIQNAGNLLCDNNVHTYSEWYLPKGTAYYYRIAAYDAAGNLGEYSDEITATTTGTPEPIMIITTAESTQIDADGTSTTLITAGACDAGGSVVTTAYNTITFSLDSTDHATLITGSNPSLSISSIWVDSGRSYVTANNIEGDQYLIDDTFLLTNIPPDHEGLTWIETAEADSNATANPFLQFDVNVDVIVHVGIDVRISPPGWMSDWHYEGECITSDEISYYLYSKGFPAGTVSLGANEGAAADQMYVVLVEKVDFGGNPVGARNGVATIVLQATSTMGTTTITATADNLAQGKVDVVTKPLNTSTTATEPTAQQAMDGTGLVSITTTINDTNDYVCRVQVEYSLNGGTSWINGDPYMDTGFGVSAGYGNPLIANTTTYQITDVPTDSGPNTITFKWDTKSATNGTGSLDDTDQTDVMIRITPNDGSTDGVSVESVSSFSIDNLDPAILSQSDLTARPNAGEADVSIDCSFTETNPGTNEFYVAINGGAYGLETSGDTGTATPSTQQTPAGAVLDGDDWISGVRCKHTDAYGNEVTSENTNPTDKYIKPYTPLSPRVDNPTASTVDVTVRKNADEAAGLEYCIFESIDSMFYVQDDNTLWSTPVWQDISSWGTNGKVTVLGLGGQIDDYYFQVKSRNSSDNLTESDYGTASSSGGNNFWLQTTDTDFALGVTSNTVITGTGLGGNVELGTVSIPLSNDGGGEWSYRRPITVTNTGGVINDYQLKVTLTMANFDNYAKCQASGDDIRFTQDDGSTELNHWAQTWNASGDSIFWVKAPTVASGSSQIYIYYGNTDANSSSYNSYDNTMQKLALDGSTVSLWHMDDGSGNPTDSTGSNNGTIVAGVSWVGSDGGNFDSASPVESFTSGDSLDFNGTSSHVTAGTTGISDVTGTAEVWFKADTVDALDYEYLICHRFGGTDSRIYIGTTNGDFFGRFGNDTGIIAGALTTGIWHHAALVWDNGNYELFLDGQSQGSSTYLTGFTMDTELHFGCFTDGSRQYFDGIIDEVRILDRALGIDEIGADYERRKYTANEPTTALDSEESLGSEPSGTFTSVEYNDVSIINWDKISWTADLSGAGTDIKFQLATNSSGNPTDFKGPGGSAGTYYTTSGEDIWTGHGSDQYLRYRAYLSDDDGNETPVLNNIAIGFTSTNDITAPSALQVDLAELFSITLSWTPGINNTNYDVERSTQQLQGYELIAEDITATNYKDEGLKARTTYYYRITGCDDEENKSDPSEVLEAVTATPDNIVEPGKPIEEDDISIVISTDTFTDESYVKVDLDPDNEAIDTADESITNKTRIENGVVDISAYDMNGNIRLEEDFSKEVELRIEYDDSDLEGVAESTLKIYVLNETVQRWVMVEGEQEVHDKADPKYVSAKLEHFSTYCIMGYETDALQILNMVNYPNPMTGETVFTFELTKDADLVELAVFTTSGRLVKKFEAPGMLAGYNEIPVVGTWNGTDEGNQQLASGVYIWKVTATAGEETVSKTEKLIIVR